MSQATPILLFVNPQSGGKVGQEIINKASSLENIHIVQLPEQQTEWTTRDRSILFHPDLRVIAAGGDGSVSWVLSMLVDFYGPQGEFQPPFGILPIGTGNDMSRTVGWGGYFGSFDIRRVPQFIQSIRAEQNIKPLDVWLTTNKRTDIPNAEEQKKYMINYFSLGVDANIALDFENFRRNNPNCFCCRCWSKTIYGPMAFGSLCMPKLKDFMRGTYTECNPNTRQCTEETTETLPDTVEKNFEFSTFAKTLVFHNIFSMMCGKDTWHDYRNRPRDFYDGMVEVSTCAGFWALTGMQLGINTYRNIARINKAEFETDDPIAYEIDGEAFMVNGPGKFTISHYCTYPILVAKEKSHPT